jgi:DNA-binding NarL/FixJ family response regulator
MSALRILVADDHPIFRHGISALVDIVANLELVGEATGGDEAVALTESLQPDLVLMDLQMPGLNGIEATRRISAACPHVRILMVTMFEDDASVFAAMRAGAHGYVLKDATKEEIVRAIQAVGNGEAIFSPAIARRLLAFFASPHPSAAKGIFPELTDREREILHLLATGAANAAIASRLNLSVKTVSNYVSNIFSKLQVADRAEAVIRARDAGLGGTVMGRSI